jgi:multidrug efflux system outer membrane protein
VSDTLVKIEKLERQQSFLKKRLKTLQQAITNSNMLFKNGIADYLEVIKTQANRLQSKLELVNIKREQLTVNIELFRSLDGGWK